MIRKIDKVNAEAEAKVTKAVASIIIDHPFFATLLLKLRVFQSQSVPTACTEGSFIAYNPEYVGDLSLKETIGLLCHEVMHVSNGHPFRLGARDHRKFNKAADYAINGILKSVGIELPSGGLHDSQYDGLAAEQIYNRLPDEPEGRKGRGTGEGEGDGRPGEGEGDGDSRYDDDGGCGSFTTPTDEQGNNLSEGQLAEQEAEWRVATQQAAQAAKQCGKLPADLARLVEDVTTPYLDWKEILRSFVQNTAKTNYDWTSPNRRFIANGLYLPSLRGEELKPLIVAVDTSGSIGDNELSQFSSELNDILNSYPCTVHVVYCDSRIAKIETVSSDEYPVKLGNYGGGGTAFTQPFEWAEGTREVDGHEAPSDPAAIIYLTDLYGQGPESCNIPTLWVSTTCPHHLPESYQPTFGEVAWLDS